MTIGDSQSYAEKRKKQSRAERQIDRLKEQRDQLTRRINNEQSRKRARTTHDTMGADSTNDRKEVFLPTTPLAKVNSRHESFDIFRTPVSQQGRLSTYQGQVSGIPRTPASHGLSNQAGQTTHTPRSANERTQVVRASNQPSHGSQFQSPMNLNSPLFNTHIP
eukprot:95219_1